MPPQQPAPSSCLPAPVPRITEHAIPAFLMSVPLSGPLALLQFRELYAFVAAHALVHLLPSRAGLQEQACVASLGALLPHLPDPTLVVSSFGSEARRGEREAAIEFFTTLGVPFAPAPSHFEGEADLKHLGSNVYVGAQGLRTSESALHWLERCFETELIRFPMQSLCLHHLDGLLFPITREEALVCTAAAERSVLRAIERHVGVIDVSLADAETGITSCVRIGDFVLSATNIDRLEHEDEAYRCERSKIMALDEICAKRGLTPVFFELSEFTKSGAGLSSLIMHLNDANFF